MSKCKIVKKEKTKQFHVVADVLNSRAPKPENVHLLQAEFIRYTWSASKRARC